MTRALYRLQPQLKRIIALRQVDPRRWRVEAFECSAGQWRFTWLLHPETTEKIARSHATSLARHTGLPVGEYRLGERVQLVGGILGRAA